MIRDLAERLAGSRRRWLIVTGVSFVTALATALPQVDHLIAARAEQESLERELGLALETAERLPRYEKTVAQKTTELERLRERTVGESQLATLRTWLVNAARQSGCQVRRIDLSPPASRPWTEQDSPVAPPPGAASKDAKTPFELQTRTVTFSVTGSTAEVVALLKALDADNRLKHASTVDLKPTNRGSRELQLELTLWYFALARTGGVA